MAVFGRPPLRKERTHVPCPAGRLARRKLIPTFCRVLLPCRGGGVWRVPYVGPSPLYQHREPHQPNAEALYTTHRAEHTIINWARTMAISPPSMNHFLPQYDSSGKQYTYASFPCHCKRQSCALQPLRDASRTQLVIPTSQHQWWIALPPLRRSGECIRYSPHSTSGLWQNPVAFLTLWLYRAPKR